jgi:hypothetical protein
MIRSMDNLYTLVYQSFGLLSILAYLSGFAVCVVHRKLSNKLLLSAIGFLGLFASSIVARLAASGMSPNPDQMFLAYLVALLIDVGSNFLLVAGLWLALVEIRRKVVLAMERDHG